MAEVPVWIINIANEQDAKEPHIDICEVKMLGLENFVTCELTTMDGTLKN